MYSNEQRLLVNERGQMKQVIERISTNEEGEPLTNWNRGHGDRGGQSVAPSASVWKDSKDCDSEYHCDMSARRNTYKARKSELSLCDSYFVSFRWFASGFMFFGGLL